MITYYRVKDGRVGMLRNFRIDGKAELQFGADGPFENHLLKDITKVENDSEEVKQIQGLK